MQMTGLEPLVAIVETLPGVKLLGTLLVVVLLATLPVIFLGTLPVIGLVIAPVVATFPALTTWCGAFQACGCWQSDVACTCSALVACEVIRVSLPLVLSRAESNYN